MQTGHPVKSQGSTLLPGRCNAPAIVVAANVIVLIGAIVLLPGAAGSRASRRHS